MSPNWPNSCTNIRLWKPTNWPELSISWICLLSPLFFANKIDPRTNFPWFAQFARIVQIVRFDRFDRFARFAWFARIAWFASLLGVLGLLGLEELKELKELEELEVSEKQAQFLLELGQRSYFFLNLPKLKILAPKSQHFMDSEYFTCILQIR